MGSICDCVVSRSSGILGDTAKDFIEKECKNFLLLRIYSLVKHILLYLFYNEILCRGETTEI